MAAEWPDWTKIEDLVRKGEYMAGNSEFMKFKKQVLKASPEEVAEQERHAPVMWDFLIGFAACKKAYRSLIIQVFNKLTQVKGWLDAWSAKPDLHKKLQTLHEDLQAALGAQHEVIAQSIAPGALASIAQVRKHETPAEVRYAMEKERLVDEIREHAALDGDAFGHQHTDRPDDAAEVTAADSCYRLLQEGIDTVIAIDEGSLESGGLDALNKLRIGVIQCAGQEECLFREQDHAHEVFSFLFWFAKRKPESTGRVAEVMNQLMASPSWAATLQGSMPLKESLQELPAATQAALGLQSEEVMKLISPDARKRAEMGDVHESVKGVADRMASIRPMTILKALAPAPAPQQDIWKEARTPEGHSYYYNLRTRESAWERPAALGGPRVYSVGDEVEVWSNGQKLWCRGTVEKVDSGRVTANFKLPGGSVAKKELPPQLQKDLRPAKASKLALESWPSEEKAAYQHLFDAIPGGKDEKPGSAVAQFLGTSGLKRAVLKQVWAVANPGNKRDLSFEEFAKCCRLVAHCQAMASTKIVVEAERPLRVKLREECLGARPPTLPRLGD